MASNPKSQPPTKKEGEKEAVEKFKEGKMPISLWIPTDEYNEWKTLASSIQQKPNPIMTKFVMKIIRDFVQDQSLDTQAREDVISAKIEEFKKEIGKKLDDMSKVRQAIPSDYSPDAKTAIFLVSQIKGLVAKGLEPEDATIDPQNFDQPEKVFDSLDEYAKTTGEILFDESEAVFMLTETAVKKVRGLA